MDLSTFFSEHGGLIIYIGSVLVGAFIFAQLGRWYFSLRIRRSAEKLNSDPTNYRFLKNSVSLLAILLATLLIVYRLPGGETIAVSIFASAGIIAAIVGFASQAVLSNIISGIFIVIFKPIRVGDLIEVGANCNGVVEDITLRHTVIRDFQNRRIIIPNSRISEETVLNFTISDQRICRHATYRISYDSDLALAKAIIKEEAEKHPQCIDWRTEAEKEAGKNKVEVRVTQLAEAGVVIRANIWSANPGESWQLFTDLNESIKARFEASNIEIPFPHRVVIEGGAG